MSANDYYEIIKNANPNIRRAVAGQRLTIKPEEFEKAIKAAFNAGVRSGKDSKSVFENIFG